MVIKAQSLNPSEEKSFGLDEKERDSVLYNFSSALACRTYLSERQREREQRVYLRENPRTIKIEVCLSGRQKGRIIYEGLAASVYSLAVLQYLGNSRVERVPSGLMR